jgi:prefoldin subunit 5
MRNFCIISLTVAAMLGCGKSETNSAVKDVVTVGPNGQVYAFIKRDDKVIARKCEDLTVINTPGEFDDKCPSKYPNERILTVDEFKDKLKKAFFAPSVRDELADSDLADVLKYRQETVLNIQKKVTELQAQIKKIEEYAVKHPDNLGKYGKDLEEYKKQLAQQGSLVQLVDKFNKLVDEVIDHALDGTEVFYYEHSKSAEKVTVALLQSLFEKAAPVEPQYPAPQHPAPQYPAPQHPAPPPPPVPQTGTYYTVRPYETSVLNSQSLVGELTDGRQVFMDGNQIWIGSKYNHRQASKITRRDIGHGWVSYKKATVKNNKIYYAADKGKLGYYQVYVYDVDSDTHTQLSRFDENDSYNKTEVERLLVSDFGTVLALRRLTLFDVRDNLEVLYGSYLETAAFNFNHEIVYLDMDNNAYVWKAVRKSAKKYGYEKTRLSWEYFMEGRPQVLAPLPDADELLVQIGENIRVFNQSERSYYPLNGDAISGPLEYCFSRPNWNLVCKRKNSDGPRYIEISKY